MRNFPFGEDGEDDEEFDESVDIFEILDQSFNEVLFDIDRSQKLLQSAIQFVNANPLMRVMPIAKRLEHLKKTYEVMDRITQYEE